MLDKRTVRIVECLGVPLEVACRETEVLVLEHGRYGAADRPLLPVEALPAALSTGQLQPAQIGWDLVRLLTPAGVLTWREWCYVWIREDAEAELFPPAFSGEGSREPVAAGVSDGDLPF